jgi:hypothetical protein
MIIDLSGNNRVVLAACGFGNIDSLRCMNGGGFRGFCVNGNTNKFSCSEGSFDSG